MSFQRRCGNDPLTSLRRQASLGRQVSDTLRLIGVTRPRSFTTAWRTLIYPLAMTASLFAGPLYSIIADGNVFDRHDLTSLEGFRNVVAVRRPLTHPLSVQAPVLEEVVFRGCICAVSLMAGMTRRQIIFATPLYFGLGATSSHPSRLTPQPTCTTPGTSTSPAAGLATPSYAA